MDMTKRERLEATIRGEAADRPPVALWRHFPGDDQDPATLAASTVAFQRQYDFDFVKVTPASSFCVRDWGAEDRWLGNEEGTREYTRRPISGPEDWRALQPLDPERGALGGQLHCLELIHQALGDQVPFIQTIFNPLSQAKNLAGQQTLLAHLRQEPEALRAGLATIAETTVRFIEAARRRGIAGIFLADAARQLRDPDPKRSTGNLASPSTGACWKPRTACGSTSSIFTATGSCSTCWPTIRPKWSTGTTGRRRPPSARDRSGCAARCWAACANGRRCCAAAPTTCAARSTMP